MTECTSNTDPSQDYLNRFSGIARLYGLESLKAIYRANMMVVGLGGVGSWAAEALARSGVGQITLIDLDDICVTNSNRQLHTVQEHVGRSKVEVMCQRLQGINPEITVTGVHDFLSKANMAELITEKHDVIIDSIDSVSVKATLIAYCSYIKKRLIVVGASGGKRDPSKITVADLGMTTADPMLSRVRNQLYHRHKFARGEKRKFRIDAVYSTEQMVYPQPDNSVCMNKQAMEGSTRLDCASGFGSSSMVTGTFGFVAATKAIERYLSPTKSKR